MIHTPARYAAAFILVGAAVCAHAEITVTPETVPYGKPAEVTVRTPGAGHVALLPGGPYRTHEYAIAGDVIALGSANKITVVRSGARALTLAGLNGEKLAAFEMPDDVLAARAQGNALLVLTARTLTLVDVRDPRAPAKLVDLAWPGGSTNVALAGRHLLQADGDNGLAIWRLDEKAAPELLARYPTTGPARDVAAQDNRAYIAQGEQGLLILDVQDPQLPFWLASHGKLGDARQVSVSGNAVLVANAKGRIAKIEVFNPAQPSFEAAYVATAAPRALSYDGKDAWIVADKSVQTIAFDAEPPQYTNAGLDVGRGVNFGGQRRADLVGDTLYVADWFSGVHIYDVADANDPEVLSTLHTPGSPKGVVVRDGYAFVADDDHGLQVVDVRNARAPRIVANVATRGLAYTPRLAGNLLYLASHRGGLQIIDVSAPTAPKIVADVETPGMAWSLALAGERLYVADDAGGLLMYDIGKPATPELIGAYDAGGRLEEVLVRDGIVYLAYFDLGVKIVDLRNAEEPRVLAEFATPGNARGLDLQGDTLYVADWLGGVHALDVADPAQPRTLWSYDTPGAAWGVRARGKDVFVLDWWGGLAVLHETERAPTITRYAERGVVQQIGARDDYLYVAHGDGGLQIFDIKNPLNPTWVTGIEELRGATAIALAGDHAYVGKNDGTLSVVDARNPYTAKVVAQVRGAGKVRALAAAGDRLYALSDAGLAAWDIKNPLRPAQVRRDSFVDAAAAPALLVLHIEDTRATLASGRTVGLLERAGKEWRPRGKIEVGEDIRGVALLNDALYVATQDGVAVYDLSGREKARFALTVPAGEVVQHRGILYIGGETTVTALKPPANVEAATNDAGTATLTLPADFPMGAYDVAYDGAKSERKRNGVRVEMPRFGKPKFTMEDLKKAMEEMKRQKAE